MTPASQGDQLLEEIVDEGSQDDLRPAVLEPVVAIWDRAATVNRATKVEGGSGCLEPGLVVDQLADGSGVTYVSNAKSNGALGIGMDHGPSPEHEPSSTVHHQASPAA